ncbi:hypothetical protein S245_000538, partial [Arachis hypogaea]
MAIHSSNNNYFYIMFICSLLFGICSSQLTSNFYDSTCPKALSIIKSAVASAVAKEHRMGASLLRLHFHDCFVN